MNNVEPNNCRSKKPKLWASGVYVSRTFMSDTFDPLSPPRAFTGQLVQLRLFSNFQTVMTSFQRRVLYITSVVHKGYFVKS